MRIRSPSLSTCLILPLDGAGGSPPEASPVLHRTQTQPAQSVEPYLPPHRRSTEPLATEMASARALPRRPLDQVFRQSGAPAPGAVVLGRDFQTPRSESPADRLMAARYREAFELYQAADAGTVDPLLQRIEASGRIRLHLATFEGFSDSKAVGYTTATVAGAGDEVYSMVENDPETDLLPLAERIWAGTPLDMDVRVRTRGTRREDEAFTATRENIAHTINHEMSLHVSQVAEVYEEARACRSVEEVAALIRRERQPGGRLDGSEHHRDLVSSRRVAAPGGGAARLMNTHARMCETVPNEAGQRRLESTLDLDIDLHRRWMSRS